MEQMGGWLQLRSGALELSESRHEGDGGPWDQGPGAAQRAGPASQILCLVLVSVSKKGQRGWRGHRTSDGNGPGDGAAAGTLWGHHSHTSPCLVVVALGGGGETPGNGVESPKACGSRQRAAGPRRGRAGCPWVLTGLGRDGPSVPSSVAMGAGTEWVDQAGAAGGFVLCMP